MLSKGHPLCFDVPQPQDDGIMWSGLRHENRAVVRTFKQGGGTASVKIEAFPGKTIDLRYTEMLDKDGKPGSRFTSWKA
jgi:hypothetical protein